MNTCLKFGPVKSVRSFVVVGRSLSLLRLPPPHHNLNNNRAENRRIPRDQYDPSPLRPRPNNASVEIEIENPTPARQDRVGGGQGMSSVWQIQSVL